MHKNQTETHTRRPLQRLVLRAVCQIKGHDWFGTAADHGYNECMRCDYCKPSEAYEPWTAHHWLYCKRWALRNWVRWQWQKLKWRFASHDDDVPF